MNTGAKIAIGVGAIVVVAGVGYLIYQNVAKKTITGGTETGGGATNTNTGAGSEPDKKADALNKVMNLVNTVKTYTTESFPLKPLMKGSNVKLMQDALRTKFNQLAVAGDGFFGFQTSKALIDLGFMTYSNLSVSKETFDKILAGVK